MAASIDQQFIEFIVKSLVSKPDEVKIERRIDEKGVLLELTVDPEDLGRVIGKRGATAQSLRTLLRALGVKNDARYNLKIVDNGEPRPRREETPRYGVANDDSAASDDDSSSSSDDMPANEPQDEESEAESTEPEAEVNEPEEDHSDVVSKTRKELEDLDDLDV